MSFTLAITDGTTTVTLTDPTVGFVTDYNPGTPLKEIVEATRAVRDGGEITGSSKKNVSGTIKVLMVGGDSTVRANKVLLEQLMEQADVFQQNKIEPRIYMQFNKDGVSETFRSELIVGRIVPSDDWLTQLAVAGKAEITILYTRRYYWEGNEIFLPLTNKYGSSVTTGIQIDNSNDASRDNFVTIASADITGDIAAPCRLEITNNFASAVADGQFFVGAQSRSTLAANDTVYEGESILGSSIASNNVNAPSSNGNYASLSWSGAGEVKVGYWLLTQTALNAANGGYYRVLWVTSGTTGLNLYTKIKISLDDASAPAVWESGYIKADSNVPITEICTVRLPPYLGYGNNIAQLRLELWVKNPAWISGSNSGSLDFILLLPVESYRIVQQKSFGLPQTYVLMIDDILEYAYTDTGAGKLGNFVATGSPIQIVPGKTNRLYFLTNTNTNTYQGNRTHTLKVAYRPRKLVV